MPRSAPGAGINKRPRRTCSCGKYAYGTRKLARGAARDVHPGQHLQVYRCDQAHDEVWHFGHPYGYERKS